MNNSQPQPVTGPKVNSPVVGGTLPDLQWFEISLWKSKNILTTIDIQARDEAHATELFAKEFKVQVKKSYNHK